MMAEQKLSDLVMDPQIKVDPPAVHKTVKRTYLVRHLKTPSGTHDESKLNTRASTASKSGTGQSFIVAHKIKAGQTLHVGNQKVSMPSLSVIRNQQKCASSANIVTVPQSLAIPHSAQGTLPTHVESIHVHCLFCASQQSEMSFLHTVPYLVCRNVVGPRSARLCP